MRTISLLLCLLCSACLSMQEQIDTNTRAISRYQATTHNEIEQLRSEIQTLSGSLEETTVMQGQAIKDIQKRLDNISAILKGPAPGTGTDLIPDAVTLNSEQVFYDQALKLYYERDYKKTKSSFQAFLKQYPNSPLAQNAFFWIGMALFQQKYYRNSISAFEDLIKAFPQGSKIPGAYYWQALSFIELKEMLTAQILLETLMQAYPSSEASQKAQTKYQELKFDTSR